MAGQQGSEEVAISTSVLVLHGLLERAKQRPVRQGSDPIVQPTGTFLVHPERLLALLAISTRRVPPCPRAWSPEGKNLQLTWTSLH